MLSVHNLELVSTHLLREMTYSNSASLPLLFLSGRKYKFRDWMRGREGGRKEGREEGRKEEGFDICLPSLCGD